MSLHSRSDTEVEMEQIHRTYTKWERTPQARGELS